MDWGWVAVGLPVFVHNVSQKIFDVFSQSLCYLNSMNGYITSALL